MFGQCFKRWPAKHLDEVSQRTETAPASEAYRSQPEERSWMRSMPIHSHTWKEDYRATSVQSSASPASRNPNIQTAKKSAAADDMEKKTSRIANKQILKKRQDTCPDVT
jgi:hypothetical protein